MKVATFGPRPVKKPVFRKLSVSCRPNSVPTSRVWPNRPVCAATIRSVWLNTFCRVVALL